MRTHSDPALINCSLALQHIGPRLSADKLEDAHGNVLR